MDEHGNVTCLRKARSFDVLQEVEEFKTTLNEKELKCMEVVTCKSHQPMLLCVVNGAHTVKKHFCETEHPNVIKSFFHWLIQDVLKPTNATHSQWNDYVFVAHNGSVYDSQFIYRNAHGFFGSNNVKVLLHMNRMIELRVQIKAVTSCSTHKIDQQETDG